MSMSVSMNSHTHLKTVQPLPKKQSKIPTSPGELPASKKAMRLSLGLLATAGAAFAVYLSRNSSANNNNHFTANNNLLAGNRSITQNDNLLAGNRSITQNDNLLAGNRSITQNNNLLVGNRSITHNNNLLAGNRSITHNIPVTNNHSLTSSTNEVKLAAINTENAICLLTEGPVSRNFTVNSLNMESCLLTEQPAKPISKSVGFPIVSPLKVEEIFRSQVDLKPIFNIGFDFRVHVPGPIEAFYRAQKDLLWKGVGSSSWTNICDIKLGWPPKFFKEDSLVREFYVGMDQAASEDGEKSLNEIGYSEMLKEATSLGLKIGPRGLFVYKEGVDPVKLEQLNAKQVEGRKIARDVCQARRANKQIARDVTSACSKLYVEAMDWRRSWNRMGYGCDYYEKKYHYNATKIVEKAGTTNQQINDMMKV